jgi:hypothetical protein
LILVDILRVSAYDSKRNFEKVSFYAARETGSNSGVRGTMALGINTT